jgi:hypothetical protein
MIVPHKQERIHHCDYNHFIQQKDEDMYKQRSIRNSSLELISSLIEVFGDAAVEAVLFVVENLFLSTPSESSPTKIKGQQAQA